MHETHFQSQFTAAAVLEYLLHALQKWSKTPWISEHTNGITIAFRAAFAFAATLGITWKYDGASHVLVIGGLSAVAIFTGLWHVISQYAMQHAFGGLVRSGNLDKIKAIVSQAVAQAIVQQVTYPTPATVAAAAVTDAPKQP